MSSRETVLITGAAGFVGAALARVLTNEGHRVIALLRDRTRIPSAFAVVYGDVLDSGVCRRAIADYGVTTIYHLAAQAIVSTCAEDSLTALEVAVMGTARLLQAVRSAGRPIKVIVTTSDKVYGSAPSPYTEATPLDARNAYEVSKACQDLVARMFFHNYGLDVRVVRAVNIYGPGDQNDTRVVPQTVQRLLRGAPPLIHAGAGAMRRQFVYVDDVVSALRTVAEHGAPGEPYCVGSPDAPMTVVEAIDEIVRIGAFEPRVPVVGERAGHFLEIEAQAVLDHKLRGIGWTPQVCFEEGIRRTVHWYRNQGGVA